MKRILDGVPISTSKDGKFCDPACPLMTFDCGTICALERALVGQKKTKSRYDEKANAYRRGPHCLRRERKQKR